MGLNWAALGLAAAVGLASAASAQDSAPLNSAATAPDQSTAAAAPKLRPLCPDRPTKSTGACTVDQGHFQLEADIFNGTFYRQNGVTTDTYLFANPTLKYGITNNADVELNLAPFEEVRVHDSRTGATSTMSGVGDLYARLKVNLFGDDGGNAALALIPYVKAPTARPGLGNGAWEGGVIAPVVFKLSDAVSLSLDPELDFLKDNTGAGLHPNSAQVIDLGWSLPHNVTLYGEVWGDWNFDPAGTIAQSSADVAVSWGMTENIQLDAGLNFGLNKQTPGVQFYTGIAKRF